MPAKLYSLALSHPSLAARKMLELKGIEHRVVYLLPGLHPLVVRGAGFRGQTVPALKLDGRRIQGSLEIARALDELAPEPPLFPRDPDRRRAVEEAERWGERELQDLPRRFMRWGVRNSNDFRRWMAADIANMPLPGLLARANKPVAARFARVSNATDEQVRDDLERLPEMLDRVDRLVTDGTIGGEQPNAADLQILSSVRCLAAFEDLRPLVEARPAARHARRLFPDYPEPIPRVLPANWLPAASA
jgi:glutathione S-transferase